MFRLIWGVVSALILSGIVLALLTVFNWDLVALGEWIVGLVTSTVNAVADFFMSLSWFQNLVSR
ncbi:hypothetical protein [Microbacterium sp. CIAB417]|uniref:hypothetical protein n=1 Tax=Microbacterium sp. CIAB417 TaxID=2860287 RepID=UPI001FABC352|nr:hypothetical protein [Microbacterium sp. CIAB417]